MLVSVLVAYCAASVVEWCIHKWLMHEPKWRVGKFHIAHHKEVRWCNCSNFSNIFILFFFWVVLVGLIWPTVDNQLFTRVPWITTCLRGLSHRPDMHTCGAIRIHINQSFSLILIRLTWFVRTVRMVINILAHTTPHHFTSTTFDEQRRLFL